VLLEPIEAHANRVSAGRDRGLRSKREGCLYWRQGYEEASFMIHCDIGQSREDDLGGLVECRSGPVD
jgi:hypothetical protein